MATVDITDHLIQASGSGDCYLAASREPIADYRPKKGYWVRLKSNQTGLFYVSTTASDATGAITILAVPSTDTFQVQTSAVNPLPAGVDWISTGDGNYSIPSVASNPVFPTLLATQAGTAAAPTPTSLWRFNAPSGDTHGPFQALVGGAFFVDTFDRVLYWGYNGADQGGNVVATEPKLTLQIEADYNDSTRHNIEFYWEYAKASGATGPTQYRPWFVQINRANGLVTSYQLNSTGGFSFSTTDGNATQWGTLGPTGLTLTPLTAQSVSLHLGWIAGGVNSLQIDNNTMGFLLQPSVAGGSAWNFGIGANSICMQLSANQLDMAQSTGNGGVIAGNGGGFFIQNNAKNANWNVLRNIGDEFYVGANSGYSGISFQAGGATAFRLGPTPSVGFYGTAPVAKATVSGAKGSNAALGSLMTALAGLGLVTDSTTA